MAKKNNQSNNHEHSHNHIDSYSNIKIAFFLNLLFTIIEIIGGLWTNSLAVLSDAVHDLGDSVSLGLSWYLEKYSKKDPDQVFSFGYSRFSLLSAFLNSLILIVGSIFVLMRALPRLFSPEPINAVGVLVFALFGITVNGLAAYKLSKGSSINEKVITLHFLEDVLGWVSILIISLIYLYKEIPILDPILSILITIYILYNVSKNFKKILKIFLQAVPKNISIDKIEEIIVQIPQVINVHHTHLWSLDGDKNLLSTHIVLDDNLENKKIFAIKESIKDDLLDYGIDHVTIEVDFRSDLCKDEECNY
ncbi:MAG: cation diffusion facilitator family transporter [Halanaerobiales bacterium]|nr:cation diffusion facilitator family transporter [Halanaerobiales bacterium]